MKCAACQRDCRSTSIATIADPSGRFRRGRVCGTCFARALHLVIAVTIVEKSVDETGERRREAKDTVRGALTKLRRLATAYRAAPSSASVGGDESFADGRAAGLDQAADILEAGDY